MIPRATYRLQFGPQFTFADAAAIVPYLARLGVSHLYASPWLKARAGSEHGYDIIDHAAFNPELGGDAGFGRLHAALAAHGLGQILDFVPNHMGVAKADNAWWLDVLEWGRASPFADFFDIDWEPADPDLHHKVLLPFLGDHYGAVLERGELDPRFDPDTGSFSVWYFEHRFPLAPRTWTVLLQAAAANAGSHRKALKALAATADRLRVRAGTTARGAARIRAQAEALEARLARSRSLHPDLHEAAAAFAVRPGRPLPSQPLHRLLERQAYRLAYWRVAADEINYRRFFDINGLAALRVENPDVFRRIHALVARLLEEGKLDGLRIDHLDGLFDPAQYCRRLRRLVSRPFPLVVEKILARHERLREDWPVDGTTGYDFLNQVTRLLTDARGEKALTHAWTGFAGSDASFDEVLHSAKEQILRTRLSAELYVLARQLHRIARRHPLTRDYTLPGLTEALAGVVAAFPVYRTYVDARGAQADDRRDIAWAVAQARKRCARSDRDVFDFIEPALTGDLAANAVYGQRRVLRFAMKFQQYTSTVMAKGFEDTALYRYHRLDALNDVGGDPRLFSVTPAAFHRANQERARHWPHALLATSTHDTKRGEDVRARIAALGVIAPEWSREVRHWARLNRGWKQRVHDDQMAPGRADEYLLYQTLLGAWPLELMYGAWNERTARDFTGRVQAYMTKAIREAKQHSSWSDPDTAYEEGTGRFIARLLDRAGGRLFLEAFLPLQRRVAEIGVRNSLVQLTLKLTCPGVPDVYQGCELWDLSLVDPDNRRAVDFRNRSRLLKTVQRWDALPTRERRTQLSAWRRHWHDGAIKLHVLHRLLALRAARPKLFAEGDYRPLDLRDGTQDHVLAFERVFAGTRLVVAVQLRGDADERAGVDRLLRMMASGGATWHEVLRGTTLRTNAPHAAESVFRPLPAAVWLNATG